MRTNQVVQLVAEDGTLHVPFEAIVDQLQREWHSEDGKGQSALLLRLYDAGDCDTIRWPLRDRDRENLKAALFDAREMGLIPDVASVLLPDGVEFIID